MIEKTATALDSFATDPTNQVRVWKIKCTVLKEQYQKLLDILKIEVNALKRQVTEKVARESNEMVY
jgi:hypothetical protein